MSNTQFFAASYTPINRIMRIYFYKFEYLEFRPPNYLKKSKTSIGKDLIELQICDRLTNKTMAKPVAWQTFQRSSVPAQNLRFL